MVKGKGIWIFLIVILVSLVINSLYNSNPAIKNGVNFVLNPTLGVLLNWNVYIGFVIIIAFISFVLTLAQKYFSDQEELRKLKQEQKILQEEMKKYRDHPEKLLELQKKQLEFLPKTFDLTLKPLIITSIPVLLLFMWFRDYLDPKLGGWWIAYYIIGSMIFSSIFRKILKVA